MSLTIKFRCEAIETQARITGHARAADGKPDPAKPVKTAQATVRLAPVPDDPINAALWTTPPAGGLVLQGITAEAAAAFRLGEECLVSFSTAK